MWVVNVKANENRGIPAELYGLPPVGQQELPLQTKPKKESVIPKIGRKLSRGEPTFRGEK